MIVEPKLIGQEINELTLESEDAKTLFQNLIEKLTQSLEGEIGFLMMREKRQSVGWSESKTIDAKRLTAIQKTLREIIETTEEEDRRKQIIISFLQKELSVSDWEVFPLFGKDDLLAGWFILGSRQQISFNNYLPQPLKTAVCVALKTVKLQNESEKKKRYKRLRQKVTEAIHNSQELDQILHSAIAQITQAIEATRGIVLMLRYAEPIFSDRRQISAPRVEVQPRTQWAQTPDLETALTPFSLANSPMCLKAWQEAPHPLIISKEGKTKANEPSFFQTPHPMSAWLITPLMGRKSGRSESQMVLGFLILQNTDSREWEEEEQELVSWVSTEASTAIIHNKTLQRVQSLVDERTAQLQRSLDVQAKLYETSRHQVEQLQQLNQLKDEFLATISHELNTPLATMKMAIQMLRRPSLPEERKEKYLGILEQEWNREYNLIKDLLTLQKIENEGISLQVETFNLKQVLMQLGTDFKTKWAEKGLDFRLTVEEINATEEQLTLESDVESLRRIFWELLSNAGKYSRGNTTVEVILSQQSENWVKVKVTNIGHGIAPAEQTLIFDRFRRGRGATQKAIPGTGLGLALVKSLVEHLHGKIDLDSEYNPDGVGKTTFSVTLPRSLNEVLSAEPS